MFSSDHLPTVWIASTIIKYLKRNFRRISDGNLSLDIRWQEEVCENQGLPRKKKMGGKCSLWLPGVFWNEPANPFHLGTLPFIRFLIIILILVIFTNLIIILILVLLHLIVVRTTPLFGGKVKMFWVFKSVVSNGWRAKLPKAPNQKSNLKLWYKIESMSHCFLLFNVYCCLLWNWIYDPLFITTFDFKAGTMSSSG